jgi:membrane protein DedA with SNARE-associated domain
MPYRKFVAWDLLGVVPWFTLVVSLGWFFGDDIAALVDRFSLGISITVVTALVGWLVWKRFRSSSRPRRSHA